MGKISAELEAAMDVLQRSVKSVRAKIRRMDRTLAILKAGSVEQRPTIHAVLGERKKFEVSLDHLLKAHRKLRDMAATEESAEAPTAIN